MFSPLLFLAFAVLRGGAGACDRSQRGAQEPRRGSACPCAVQAAALPRVPEPVDRQFRSRPRARPARDRAREDRGGRERPGRPQLPDRALWRFRAAEAARRAAHLGTVVRPVRLARRGRRRTLAGAAPAPRRRGCRTAVARGGEHASPGCSAATATGAPRHDAADPAGRDGADRRRHPRLAAGPARAAARRRAPTSSARCSPTSSPRSSATASAA